MSRTQSIMFLPPPKRIRAKKTKEKIGYAIGTSTLGKILVASCEMGVLAILVGKDKRALLDDLCRSFPDTDPHPDDWGAKDNLARVLQFIENPRGKLGITLYLKGTPFQKRIWQTVQKIPFGETRTYSEIARDINKPRAMRAVGSTCTRNNLFMAVPCHRVVPAGKSKSLGKRRQFLLAREAKMLRNQAG